MSAPDLGRGRLNQPLWLTAAACVVAAYLLSTFSHFTLGELTPDDAATFFVANRSLHDALTLPVTAQGQPPLFFLALHGWLAFGDSEPVLRLLPLAFMLCAAITLLATPWLSPVIRVVSVAAFLLASFSDYLTPTLRPYSLAAWFSLWSSLAFTALLREERQGAVAYVRYIVATLLLAYSLTLAVWVLLAQGICAVAAVVATAVRGGVRYAARRNGALLLSLAIVALSYLPHAIGFLHFQAALDPQPVSAAVAAGFNPRYYISGPLYLLAMPAGLGYVAVILAIVALWSGVSQREPLVAVLATMIVVQIAATHGLLAGRYGFSFRYLTPIYPALCLLVGIGADRCASVFRRADAAVAVGAAFLLAAACVAFARAPRPQPAGPWRQVAAELRLIPGTKIVFFDVGWDGQPLAYETRRDPDIRLMADAGSGWNTFGRMMTPDYVARTIDREARPGTMFFFDFDAMLGRRILDDAFTPAMARNHCAAVYQRVVPTYERSDNDGALLYGYRCSGT